jgi:hypothetical protein
VTDRTPPACPKCRAAMEPGFVLDQTYGALAQSAWIEGRPQPSFWTGLKVKDAAKHPVTTYRCTKCGYLESYA